MAAMKPHGTPRVSRRKQSAQFELAYSEAQALHNALRAYLDVYGVTICGEVVTGDYAPNSQLDSSVRLTIRLNRYLLGGKHFNHRIAYDSSVASIRSNNE